MRILFLLIALIICNTLQAQCDRERDSLALVSLYNSTDGPNWDDKWDLSEPFRNWRGIEVNSQGCVIKVFFPDLCPSIANAIWIAGELPPEIGNLLQLEELVLNRTNVRGSIPSEISNLKELKFLNLNFNKLTGQIPEGLGSLPNLELISLWDNDLEGCLPNDFMNLCSINVNLTGNEKLPWSGLMEKYCSSESQVGSHCNDDDPNTIKIGRAHV